MVSVKIQQLLIMIDVKFCFGLPTYVSGPKQNLIVSDSNKHCRRTNSGALATMSRYFVWRFLYKNMLLMITEEGGGRSLLVAIALSVAIRPISKQYCFDIEAISLQYQSDSD